jgi:hypothetical protein
MRSCTIPASGPEILKCCFALTFGFTSSSALAPALSTHQVQSSIGESSMQLPVERNLGGKASDLGAVVGLDVRHDGVRALDTRS